MTPSDLTQQIRYVTNPEGEQTDVLVPIVIWEKLLEAFQKATQIDLLSMGIDPAQAQTLRESLGSFAEDWDSPAMSIYDDYDTAKTNL